MELEALNSVEIKKEKFKEELTKVIEKKLKDLESQIIIEVLDKGVRIQLVDQEKGNAIFERGSVYLTDTAKRALMVITESLNGMPNGLAIEGHTDSLSFSGTKYTNWELSTDRASSARRAMEEFGLNPKRIMQVAGYADTQLLMKGNPNDPKNRRISILVAFTKDKQNNKKP
jgi:chemotaxis protein MotB